MKSCQNRNKGCAKIRSRAFFSRLTPTDGRILRARSTTTFIQPEKRFLKMVTRRDVASIVGLGAMAAATLASPAVAQTAADPNE
jgi:hypothetical protein